MRPAPRRLTFQLVSLFDLLIIIVFAQYFDVRDASRREIEQLRAASEQAGQLAASERQFLDNAGDLKRLLGEELDRLKQELELLQAESARREFELNEELVRSRTELARLGALVAELFDLPEDEIERLLKSRSPEESDRIRRALAELAANRGSQAVRHILTLAELRKRCDIWQIHVGDDNTLEFRFEERRVRFRADSAERFENELFKQYKNLPQPKSLVVILLSWGDADLKSRAEAIEGLENASERMRIDTDRRTRFEYAVLGYIPATNQESP
jgi:hypothetical protein